MRYSGARTGEGLGVAFDVGGVVEAQRQWPVDCLTTACQQDFVSGVVPTGRARIGLDSPYFGLRGGVLAFAEPQYAQGLHGGLGYVTHGTIGLRETATVRAPLTEHLWLRSDFGVTQSQDVGTDFVLSVGWGM